MNKKIISIFLFLLILSALLSAQNEVLVFNDFNSGNVCINNLGYVSSYFIISGGSCSLAAENNYTHVFGKFGYSLRLDYNIIPDESVSGYWSKMHDHDLSKYNYLSFWIKGAAGQEYIKVQIKVQNVPENEAKAEVVVNEFLDNGITTEWQKVIIPLDTFLNIREWHKVDEMVFTLENTALKQNNKILKSSVYIDNIIFGSSFLGFVPIDYVNDLSNPLTLGGQTGTAGNNASVQAEFSDQYYVSKPYSIKCTYDVSTLNSYAYYYMVLGGGYDGWQTGEHDLSQYDKLSLKIKAHSAGKNPCGLKLEMHDFSGIGTGEPFYTITNSAVKHITTNWQTFNIPLSGFMDFDQIRVLPEKIQELVITFENSNSSNVKGIVYIDDIMLIAADYTNDPDAPGQPYGLKDNDVLVTDNHIFTYNSRLKVFGPSAKTDPYLECITFEYTEDNKNWKIFKREYDIRDSYYEAELDMDNFSESGTNSLRVGAENIYGKTTYLGPYGSIQFKKVNYKDTRSGKLISMISIENNPFSPFADGDADRAKFHYIVRKKAEISLKIMDISGNLIWQSEAETVSADEEHSITWDGKTVFNETVNSGIYFYKLSAAGEDGSSDQIIHVIGVIR